MNASAGQDMQRRLLWTAAEILIVSLLVGSWTAGFLAADADLGSPIERQVTMRIHKTIDPLWLGYWLGLIGILSPLARRFNSSAAFGACAVFTAATGFWFSYAAAESFALEAAVVVGSFLVVRADGRWPLYATIGGLSLIVGNARQFEINGRLERLGADTSGVIGPANRILALLVLLALAIATAQLVRRVSAQAAQLEWQNKQLVEGRRAGERAAVLDERFRIARELHDVIAHHVTAMTVHAGAARQLSTLRTYAGSDNVDDSRVVEALGRIEASGRTAVSELHHLLGFLRDQGSESTDAASGLDDLERLAASVREQLNVDLTITGDRSLVPQQSQSAIYRIVQESLTNVLKHSAAQHARVEVALHQNHVDLTVVDPGPPHDRAAATSGHGLIGIHERVTQHAGSAKIGPGADRSWHVEVQLPYRVESA